MSARASAHTASASCGRPAATRPRAWKIRFSARLCLKPEARYSSIARFIGASDSSARPIARSVSANDALAVARWKPGAPIDSATMASARMLRLSSNAPRYCISSPTRVFAMPISVGQPVAAARAAAVWEAIGGEVEVAQALRGRARIDHRDDLEPHHAHLARLRGRLPVEQRGLGRMAVFQRHAARCAPQRVERDVGLGPRVARRLEAEAVVDARLGIAALEAEPHARDREAVGGVDGLVGGDGAVEGGHLAVALHAHLAEHRLDEPGVALGARVGAGVEVLARLGQPAFGDVEVAQQRRRLARGERGARAVRVAPLRAVGRGREQRDDAVDQSQRAGAVTLAQVPGELDGGREHAFTEGLCQHPLEYRKLGVRREELHPRNCRCLLRAKHRNKAAPPCQMRHIRRANATLANDTGSHVGRGAGCPAATAARCQAGVNGSVRYSLPRSVSSPVVVVSRLVKCASLAQRPVNHA